MIKKPKKIEAGSFEIIDREIGEHSFTDEEYQVVRRVIHASADFDFKENLGFSDDAIASGLEAIKAGTVIVCDVQMVQSGINRELIKKFNSTTACYVSDEDVRLEAEKEGVTRSMITMRKAVKKYPGGIFAIGNAPTALLELISLVRQGIASPALVVGVPVGFVSAVESKEELTEIKNTPWIAARGRKGGSPIAVAIVNAILHIANGTYSQKM